MEEQQRVMKGLALVSMAALVAKMLSAIYRVPYQNLAGDIGFYVYQQIYPLYGFVMVLSMYGLPIALSNKRVELIQLGKNTEAKQVTSLFFYSLLVIIVILWSAIYAQADSIAIFMGDASLKEPIKAMSFILFFIPFLSVGRGYAQSEGELASTAVSHIGEQLTRVSCIIGLTVYFVFKGANAYEIGAGAAYGSWIGAAIGAFLLVVMTKGRWLNEAVYISWRHIPFKQIMILCLALVKNSFFICISALVLILFQLVDALSLVRLLEFSGMEQTQAYIEKGVYDRGQPLIQVGAVLTTTFTLALVPLITKAVTIGNNNEAHEHQHTAFRLTLLIAGAATIGLFVIMTETNHMLFTDSNGSDVLRILALVVMLQSLFVTMAAIFQGYSLSEIPVKAVLYGLIVKVGGHLIFVPQFGITAAAWSTIAGFVFMVCYLLYNGYKRRVLSLGSRHSYRAILFVLTCLLIICFLFKQTLLLFFQTSSRLTDAMIAASTSLVGIGVIIVLMIVFPIFNESEWEKVPFLHKLRVFLMKRR
ncbi:polysaccharide biosynthesis protein [Bacillus sp. JCM 19034]|uniref:putative polysaccharide biosynthesis protein n=1 Tax=Bacillus sp. JCM 19034 TaxID=1481928 RepID=UPI0007822F2F|nr:polysaccharide biosynthesis protein [Bacillus sp. JCM 19034]